MIFACGVCGTMTSWRSSWWDCMEDAYDFAGEHGDDATDALLPFEIDAATDGVYLPRRYWEQRSDQVEHLLEQAVASYREPIDADEKGGE